MPPPLLINVLACPAMPADAFELGQDGVGENMLVVPTGQGSAEGMDACAAAAATSYAEVVVSGAEGQGAW